MSTATTTQTLVDIQNLSVAFPTDEGLAYAVKGLSLQLKPNEILGLVGESGCGKSLTSMALMGLVPKPGQVKADTLRFDGQDLLRLDAEAYRKIRGAQIALIPQDPLTSLNPVYTIANQMNEVLMLHQGLSEADATKRAIELLDMVRVPNAAERIGDYPHQFSGGMR
ncbi:MAG: ABC transporter ATP-binding protein, partial [Cyanobacteria bacterium HKST-UBA05]|nr:ABC transporter ATP-binding protein [Cyanobacteria bacterium HKST-UBA05]